MHFEKIMFAPCYLLVLVCGFSNLNKSAVLRIQ
uniref:Uncharacterized protein n=1 Tax=Arundo donax TaxID=35708 RepID=A0A0A9EDA0_ARUDO